MPNVKQSNLIQIMKKKKVFITVTLCMVCAISAFIGLNTEKNGWPAPDEYRSVGFR